MRGPPGEMGPAGLPGTLAPEIIQLIDKMGTQSCKGESQVLIISN